MFFTKMAARWTSAFKAGMIAHGCDDCVVDDIQEAIRPCPVHSLEIDELAKINEANFWRSVMRHREIYAFTGDCLGLPRCKTCKRLRKAIAIQEEISLSITAAEWNLEDQYQVGLLRRTSCIDLSGLSNPL